VTLRLAVSVPWRRRRGAQQGAQRVMGEERQRLPSHELPYGLLRVVGRGGRRLRRDGAAMPGVRQRAGVRGRRLQLVLAVPARLLQGGCQHRRMPAVPGRLVPTDCGRPGAGSMPSVPGQGHDGRGDGPERPIGMHVRRGLLPCCHCSQHLRDMPHGRSVHRQVVCSAQAAVVQLH